VGRIAHILSFLRVQKVSRGNANISEVKCKPGGGVNVTVEHYADIGDDSHPLNSDYVAIVPVNTSGSEIALGYADVINAPNDKRIYSRDQNTGAMIADVWLKADGSIICTNANGSFSLMASGDFVVNGVTIDTNGNITTAGTVSADTVEATNSLTIAGKELKNHTHTGSLTAPVGLVSNTGVNV